MDLSMMMMINDLESRRTSIGGQLLLDCRAPGSSGGHDVSREREVGPLEIQGNTTCGPRENLRLNNHLAVQFLDIRHPLIEKGHPHGPFCYLMSDKNESSRPKIVLPSFKEVRRSIGFL